MAIRLSEKPETWLKHTTCDSDHWFHGDNKRVRPKDCFYVHLDGCIHKTGEHIEGYDRAGFLSSPLLSMNDSFSEGEVKRTQGNAFHQLVHHDLMLHVNALPLSIHQKPTVNRFTSIFRIKAAKSDLLLRNRKSLKAFRTSGSKSQVALCYPLSGEWNGSWV
jgi:hypothetical protein